MATGDIDTKQAALTPEQERFCQLYVCGGRGFAGQILNCFREAFGPGWQDALYEARRLVRMPHIMARIKELVEPMYTETEVAAIKMQITETLRAVMEEASNGSFCDKFGNPLSPAPLRAVSVNAAKALMELYPVKHEHETKLRIEGADGGVVFNVIVPQKPGDNADSDER
jgi:phage terminase small subunit